MTSLIASIAVAWAAPAACAAGPAFSMEVLDSLPYNTIRGLPCGDANSNGRHELYLLKHHTTCMYALEYGPTGFDTTPLGVVALAPHPLEFGDGDRDGRDELLLVDVCDICVWERRLGSEFPDSLVWLEHLPRVVGLIGLTYTDLDCDSVTEIAASSPSWGYIALYKNTADNAYELLAILDNERTRGNGPLVETYDMDRDGRPELVSGSSWGWVTFYEHCYRDSFACVGYDRLSPEGIVRALQAAPDMDQDGLPELVAYGFRQRTGEGILAVYECPGDNDFRVVWQRQIAGAVCNSGYSVTVGDVDGDSVPEFAVTTGKEIQLYRCAGNDAYELWWSQPNYYGAVRLYDIDRDGRCELVYSATWSTVIRKYVPGGISGGRSSDLSNLTVLPSVTRGAVVSVAGIADGAEVVVVDAAGRVVARPRDGVWNPRGVSPGAYFVRVRSGNQAVVQKVLVLR